MTPGCTVLDLRSPRGDRTWALPNAICVRLALLATGLVFGLLQHCAVAGLQAGAAKVDVTDRSVGQVNGPLHVRALVLRDDDTTVVIITVDVVAIGEIGPIGNDYLSKVRAELHSRFGIRPEHVLINASHCHGVVRRDIDRLTVQAVQQALDKMVPVKVGAGTGYEDRIQENRRLRLKDGTEADVRHAYALPPDEQIAAVGPIDPEIGILRLDRLDGRTLAVVYNFACHPIKGVADGANTSDLSGFSSSFIEAMLGDDAVAMFVQGCAGDINPIDYKNVDVPPDADRLGYLLGASTLEALRRIRTEPVDEVRMMQRIVRLPLANYRGRIRELEAERNRLVASLRGTHLDLKSFVSLYVKYKLSPTYPSAPAYRYLHERQLRRSNLTWLDEVNRKRLEDYIHNIRIMERLTRINTNLALLRKNQAKIEALGGNTIDVEVNALCVGDFVLLTFPGELTVQIGLDLKRRAPQELTFIAGYTNGYIYYCPTAEQLRNVGNAQEDSDCLVAPEWEAIFKRHALDLLQQLATNR